MEDPSYRMSVLARCPICAVDTPAFPASRHDGRWEALCPEHGTVLADYRSQTEILNDPRCSRCWIEIERHLSGMCDSCETQERFERGSEVA